MYLELRISLLKSSPHPSYNHQWVFDILETPRPPTLASERPFEERKAFFPSGSVHEYVTGAANRSRYNVVRDAYYDLPTSKYYGKSIIALETKSKLLEEQSWRWYPWPTKITTPGEHPEALYADPALKTLKSTAGATYLDQYMLRLAETYLLRAEAFLMKGDKEKAANDINEVRNRAHTSEVVASEVTIDYILDERARELVYEEFRRITLGRLGKYVERVRKYNTLNGPRVEDYHELFPIPYSAIEANKDAV